MTDEGDDGLSMTSERGRDRIEMAIISDLIDHFNERMFTSTEDNEEQSFLKNKLMKLVQSEPFPALTIKFLNLIKILNRKNLKRIAIEFIPKICGSSEEENTKIIDVLDSIFKSENSLTRIVISTLYKLENLKDSQQQRILFIAQNALESVEEEDLDDIVKIMLKNMTKKNSSEIVKYIREKVANDDAAIVRISSELLADTFSTTPSMANYFLKSLKAEQEEFSKFDVLILMILLSTRHRERSSTFALFKNAFLNKPKRIVNISTILDALSAVGSLLDDCKYVERIYNSIYIFIIYLLSNSELFTDERGVPWVYSIFIHSFKSFQPLRSKFLTSLLALFQYTEESKSSIAAEILIGLCDFETDEDDDSESTVNLCKQIALNHLSIIKDSLAHAVSYSIRCQHSLCYALAKCSIHNPKTFEYLMIFIRKQIFSGQEKKSQLGLIISMHLIHETHYMVSSDIDRFVFSLFNTKNFDENSIHILDLFIYNFEKLRSMGLTSRMKAIIVQLVKNLAIIDTFPEISPQSNFQFRKFCSINTITLTSLRTLSMLVKCYILCHETETHFLSMALMQMGAKGISKEELMCVYSIGFILYDHVIEKNDTIDVLDEDDQASLVDYTEYLLQLRIDIASSESINSKMNVVSLDSFFKLFPLSAELISLFISKYNHDFEDISMKKEREAFKCLWFDFDLMLKYLLLFKSDEEESENQTSDKGKGIFTQDFKILSPKRVLLFGSLLEGRKSPSSIFQFVSLTKKIIKVLVKKSYKFTSLLSEKKSNMKVNQDTQDLDGKEKVDHLVLCLSYIYSSLSNVFFVTRNINEDAFEKLICTFKKKDTSLATNLVYLIRLILKQIEDASYFIHALQLNLILVSICQGKELQKIIGYVGLDLLTRVFSSTSQSAIIEKIALESYVFKELPFHHLLSHGEIAIRRRNPNIPKYLNQSTLLFALTYLPSEEGRDLADFFVLALDDFLHAMKEDQDVHIQHHPLSILDENSFHYFLQIFTKIFEMAIINAPCVPVDNGGNRNFIRIEDPLDNIRKVILIYRSFQESDFLRKKRKDR